MGKNRTQNHRADRMSQINQNNGTEGKNVSTESTEQVPGQPAVENQEVSVNTTETAQQAPAQAAEAAPEQQSSAPAVQDQGVQDTGAEKPNDEPVKPEPAPAPAPVPAAAETQQIRQETQPKVVAVGQTKGATVKDTAAPSETDFEAWVVGLRAEGNPRIKSLVSGIQDYIARMKPGMTVQSDAGARAQYNFWMLIKSTVESSPEEEFRRLWNTLLRFFDQYKDGVFHERFIYRFSEYWTQDPTALAKYQHVLNLIKLTANPSTRQAGLKQVSLDRTLEGAFSDLGKQRILTFYMQ